MAARFYAPDLNPAHGRSAPAEEAHHLVRVLRLGPGRSVAVFDGRGDEWRARVERPHATPSKCRCSSRCRRASRGRSSRWSRRCSRASAMDDVVRDCTMVGVAAIQPVVTARTTVKTSSRCAAPERWRRIALASAKQCGAARLPAIREVMRFDEWLAAAPCPSLPIMLVEPGAPSAAVTICASWRRGRCPSTRR